MMRSPSFIERGPQITAAARRRQNASVFPAFDVHPCKCTQGPAGEAPCRSSRKSSTMQTAAPARYLGNQPATSPAIVPPDKENRPDLVGKIRLSEKPWDQRFDPNGLRRPGGPGTWGNLPAKAVRGPGTQNNWNLSVFKSFVFSESRRQRRPLSSARRASNTWKPHANSRRGIFRVGGISTNLGR